MTADEWGNQQVSRLLKSTSSNHVGDRPRQIHSLIQSWELERPPTASDRNHIVGFLLTESLISHDCNVGFTSNFHTRWWTDYRVFLLKPFTIYKSFWHWIPCHREVFTYWKTEIPIVLFEAGSSFWRLVTAARSGHLQRCKEQKRHDLDTFLNTNEGVCKT